MTNSYPHVVLVPQDDYDRMSAELRQLRDFKWRMTKSSFSVQKAYAEEFIAHLDVPRATDPGHVSFCLERAAARASRDSMARR